MGRQKWSKSFVEKDGKTIIEEKSSGSLVRGISWTTGLLSWTLEKVDEEEKLKRVVCLLPACRA